MRRLLALFLPFLLLLTACSQGSDPATSDSSPNASVSAPPSNSELLDSVKVTGQGAGKVPTITFDKPLTLDKVAIRRVADGDGAQIKADQSATIRIERLNAETGESIVENFTAPSGEIVAFNDQLKQYNPLVYDAFVGAKVGAFIAYGIPAQPAVPATASQAAQEATPAAVEIYQVESAKDPAKPMSADEVAALEKDGKLPTAKFDDKGVPSITIPKTDAPEGLAVQVLTEGKGEVLKDTDTISALYTGWTWSDSKVFDSAYDRGEAATFGLQQVIEGWTLGLAGQKVGSTVLLSIPSDLAYGPNAAASGKPEGALVFVVKIESKK